MVAADEVAVAQSADYRVRPVGDAERADAVALPRDPAGAVGVVRGRRAQAQRQRRDGDDAGVDALVVLAGDCDDEGRSSAGVGAVDERLRLGLRRQPCAGMVPRLRGTAERTPATRVLVGKSDRAQPDAGLLSVVDDRDGSGTGGRSDRLPR